MTIDRRPSPPGYEFAAWDQVTGRKSVERWIRAASKENRFPLFIHGGTGTGKTCLAALLFRRVTWPMWRRCDDFLLTLATSRGDSSFVAQKDRAANCSCLFLDDIGLREPTETMQQILFDLLELRKGKPTVITSNHSPETLKELYDDRIRSRILAGTIIEIAGSDRREGQGKRHLARSGE